MQLRLKTTSGEDEVFPLPSSRVSLGRTDAADMVVNDPKISRIHCEIQLWDSDSVVKDLHSQNGTYVNGTKIDVAVLHPGMELRIGSSTFTVENTGTAAAAIGENTAIREIEGEMDDGKGFGTIMRKIVHDIDEPAESSDLGPS